MIAQSGSRLRSIQLMIACIVPVLFALHGCEPDAEQRLANARELLKHKQSGQSASANVQTPLEGAPLLSGSDSPQPAEARPAPSGILPLYPGSRKISTGAGAVAGLDDGLTMEMLETHDSVDAVIEF